MVPERRLNPIIKLVSLVSRPSSVGISPMNLLLCKSNSFNASNLPMLDDNEPLRLFVDKTKIWSDSKSYNRSGILPFKSLAPRSKMVNFFNFPIWFGIGPERKLASRSKLSKFLNFSKDFPKVPSRLFVLSEMALILVRRKKSNGMDP
jgi:hypothetical protein